jgi:hypothetical protein
MCPKNFPRYLQIKKCCKFCNVYSSSWSKKVIVKHIRALLTGLGDDAEAKGVKGRGIDLVPNLPDFGGHLLLAFLLKANRRMSSEET